MKPSQSVLVLKTLLVTFFVACSSFGQSANRIIDLSKVRLSNKTGAIKNETRQGPGSGGGGNTCALMLKQNAIALIEKIKTYPPFQKDGIADLLIANISAAQFYPGDNLQIDGKDVEAINYPTKKIIEVEQGFCDKVSTFSAASFGITLHEYLGLAGLADENYQVSGPFVDNLYTLAIENTAEAKYTDPLLNNLRIKFGLSTPVVDEDGTKIFNLSCTYFSEVEGKSVQQTLTLQRASAKKVLMQTEHEAVSLKAELGPAGLMITLPEQDPTSYSFMVLREVGIGTFIAEWSITGKTLPYTMRLRNNEYPVPSTSVIASQAMGYSVCSPRRK